MDVAFQVVRAGERLATMLKKSSQVMNTHSSRGSETFTLNYRALEWFIPSVRSDVRLKLLSGEKRFRAVRTLVVPNVQVLPLPVVDECGNGAEGPAALGAEVRFLTRVHGHVDQSLLVAGEALGAD